MAAGEGESKEFDYSKLREDRVFITLCGLIGAGKSTLTKALADLLEMPAYYEEVEGNEYLADFYADKAKFGFQLQIHLLTRRFRQHQRIVWEGDGAVQDRSIYEDAVFARMLTDGGFMTERDFRTYQELFSAMSNFMRRPHMIVYLKVSPEVSLERIRKRGRECEKGITIEYLRALYDAYEKFVHDISRSIPVVTVDYATFRSPEEMATAIAREYARVHNVRVASFGATIGKIASPSEEKEETSTGEAEGRTEDGAASPVRVSHADETVLEAAVKRPEPEKAVFGGSPLRADE